MFRKPDEIERLNKSWVSLKVKQTLWNGWLELIKISRNSTPQNEHVLLQNTGITPRKPGGLVDTVKSIH